jgi:hypothetical protein
VPVKFLRSVYCRKTAALAFIALLVCIHVAKAAHTHDLSSYACNAPGKNTTAVKASFSCAICDFQVAKDSDAMVSDISIAAPVCFITLFYNYSLPVASAFAVVFCGRGPPALA